MTAQQLELDVGYRPTAAAIETRLLAELDHFHQHPPSPDDTANSAAQADLIRGHEVLLSWLAQHNDVPSDPLVWPCAACLAAPGQPCDIPGTRTKWTPPGPRYHLDRGLTGRWSSTQRNGAPQ